MKNRDFRNHLQYKPYWYDTNTNHLCRFYYLERNNVYFIDLRSKERRYYRNAFTNKSDRKWFIKQLITKDEAMSKYPEEFL